MGQVISKNLFTQIMPDKINEKKVNKSSKTGTLKN